MLEKLSAAQLVKVFNAVTDREKPVKKFESQPRALHLTRLELTRMGVSPADALARVGMAGEAAIEAATKIVEASRVAPPVSDRFTPTAVNVLTGQVVELPRRQDPAVRTVEDPEKAAAKIAKSAVAELRQARQERQAAKAAKAARQAPLAALKRAVADGVAKHGAVVEIPAAPAPASDGLTADQRRLLVALIDCKALADKPLHQRAGVWVKYKAIHESDTPHNLDKARLPGLTRALRLRGMLELRGSSANGEVRLTSAALEA